MDANRNQVSCKRSGINRPARQSGPARADRQHDLPRGQKSPRTSTYRPQETSGAATARARALGETRQASDRACLL